MVPLVTVGGVRGAEGMEPRLQPFPTLPPGPVIFLPPQGTTSSSPRALLGRAEYTVPVELEAQLEMEYGMPESSLK